MKTNTLKALALSFAAATISTTSAMAADITMNVGFGAPEASIYGRFGAHFERLTEEMSGGQLSSILVLSLTMPGAFMMLLRHSVAQLLKCIFRTRVPAKPGVTKA